MGPHRVEAAAVVRPGVLDRAPAAADHHGHAHLAVAHVAEPGGLEHDLAAGLPEEIGHHQVGHAAAPGGRGPHRGPREAQLADRRVDHPLRAELLEKPLGVGEGPAPQADALAEVDDVWVAAHFFGDPVAHRLQPALEHGPRLLAVARRVGHGRVDRLGPHVPVHGGRVRLGRAPRVLDRLLDLPLHVRVHGFDRLGSGHPPLQQQRAEPLDRAARGPDVDLLRGAIRADHRIARVVPHYPVRPRLDERGSLAGPCPLDRLARGPPYGEHVIAVDRLAGDAVGRGLAGHVGVARGHGQRRGRGVEVVLAHEHDRGILDAGEVDRLVERPVVHCPVAEEGDRHLVRAPDLGAQAQADGRRDARGHNTICAEQADGGGKQMHRAATAAVAARGPAEQLGHEGLGRHALGQRVTVAAMRAGDPVVAP